MFSMIQPHTQQLKFDSLKIALQWSHDDIVAKKLRLHLIDPRFFAKHFGTKIIDHVLSIISGEIQPGNCPVIHVLLEIFSHKKIPLSDLYFVCSGLKSTLLMELNEKKVLCNTTIKQVALLLDTNFEGVMLEYSQKMHDPDCNKLNNIHQCLTEKCTAKAQKKKVSSSQYVASTFIAPDELQELKELEEDALQVLDCEIFTDSVKFCLMNIVGKYCSILSKSLEFSTVETSLKIFLNVIELLEVSKIEGNIQYSLTSFCRALVKDFSVWREGVFGVEGVSDIHWMDDNLLAIVAQLEILITSQPLSPGYENF